MSPDPMMSMGGPPAAGPSPADFGTMMPGGSPPPDAANQPSPLLILLMQLLQPSINAASMGGGMMGMPPAAMDDMGGMPNLGQTMQPTTPAPMPGY